MAYCFLLPGLDGFASVADDVHTLVTEFFKLFQPDQLVDFVVFRQKMDATWRLDSGRVSAAALEHSAATIAAWRPGVFCLRKRQCEPKSRALSQTRCDADGTAHQFDKLAADGQAQTRAAKTAGRRGIRLRERLKQFFLRFLGYPDAGVTNGETAT